MRNKPAATCFLRTPSLWGERAVEQPRFTFTLTKSYLAMPLNVPRNGDEVSLSDKKPVIVLSSSPAVLMLGRELHVFNHWGFTHTSFTHKAQVSVDASRAKNTWRTSCCQYHALSSRYGFGVRHCRRAGFMRTASHRKPDSRPDWGIRLHFTYGDQEFTHNACATAKIARLDNTTENIRIVYFERHCQGKTKHTKHPDWNGKRQTICS